MRDKWVNSCKVLIMVSSKQLFQLLCLKEALEGLPWWFSDWESTCQCRGHGFNPWSRKIPHDMQQLSPCATITEPVPWNKRSRHNEKLTHYNEGQPPTHRNQRKPSHSNKDPEQPKINNLIKLKRGTGCMFNEWMKNEQLNKKSISK